MKIERGRPAFSSTILRGSPASGSAFVSCTIGRPLPSMAAVRPGFIPPAQIWTKITPSDVRKPDSPRRKPLILASGRWPSTSLSTMAS